jgi:hypothetical protein
MNNNFIVKFNDESLMTTENLFEYGMFTRGYSHNNTWSIIITVIAIWVVVLFVAYVVYNSLT